MLRRLASLVVSAALLIGIVLPSSHAKGTNERRPTARVLFVGNSYTLFNHLPEMVRLLSETSNDGGPIQVARVAWARASLRSHWEHGDALARIRAESFTHVVLQGNSLSAVDEPAELAEYAARFAREIQLRGGRTVFYATWARHRRSPLYRMRGKSHSPEEMQTQIDLAYDKIARTVDADVAPVGAAWRHALALNPRLRLHREDYNHPTVRGSYLAACVLYQVLSGVSAEGNTYHPPEITAEDAAFLQDVASNTVRELR